MNDLEGAEFRDPAYMSTALTSKLPPNLASREVIMKIKVPKGTPSFYVPAAGNARYPKEQELILGRGRRFRITNSRRDPATGKRYVEAEVLS